MEETEIKEESALNWWQIYEDSLDGRFSYVKEKDESGQEKKHYITNVQDYAKLWFQDKSFRIRKLESFKTKEEHEMDVGVLERTDIVKRFSDGIYDWNGETIAPPSKKRPADFYQKYEKVYAFQSGTVETNKIKEKIRFDARKIRMYDASKNIGFICSGKPYFENKIPAIEISTIEYGILRRDAISYIMDLKKRVQGPLKERIGQYLENVAENLKRSPRIIYHLADSRFKEQLKGKQVDFYILKNNKEPSGEDVLLFPKAGEFLFDFGEDRISSLALRDAQGAAGGEVFLKFFSRENRDVEDLLSTEMSNLTKKKNQFELNVLKLESMAYQSYMVEFLSLAREFHEAARGKTFFVGNREEELATAIGLLALDDHRPLHGEHLHREEGIVDIKDKTDFCEGRLAYHLRAPLLFQRTKHATLTFVLPFYEPDVTVCLILSKKESFFDETTDTYVVENTRFGHVNELNDEMKKNIMNAANVVNVVHTRTDDGNDQITIKTKTMEQNARERVMRFGAKRKQFMPKANGESSIQHYHTVLEPLEEMDDGIPFINGVFCETCIEALPAPLWHRSRPKTFWEKCTSLVGSVRKAIAPKREIEDREGSLRDAYALVVPKGGKLGPTKLIFRCFGIEHETDTIVSKDRLELHYEKKGSAESAYTVSRIYVLSHDEKTGLDTPTTIARCDTSQEYEGHIGWDICDAALDIEDGYRKTDTYLRIFTWACERFANPSVLPHYSKRAFGELISYMMTLADRFDMEEYGEKAAAFLKIKEAIPLHMSIDADFEKNISILSKLLYRYKAEKIFYEKNIIHLANEMREPCYRRLEEWIQNPALLNEIDFKKLMQKKEHVRWGVTFAYHLMVILPGSSLSSLKTMYDVVLKDIHNAAAMYEKTNKKYERFLAHYQVTDSPDKSVVRFQAMAMLSKLCGV